MGAPASSSEAEVAALRAEIARLRRLLDLLPSRHARPPPHKTGLFLDRPGPVTASSSGADKVRFFRTLFAARTDVYANRWKRHSSARPRLLRRRPRRRRHRARHTGGRPQLDALSRDAIAAAGERRSVVARGGSSWTTPRRAVGRAAERPRDGPLGPGADGRHGDGPNLGLRTASGTRRRRPRRQISRGRWIVATRNAQVSRSSARTSARARPYAQARATDGRPRGRSEADAAAGSTPARMRSSCGCRTSLPT